MGWAYSVDLRERVVTAINVADMTDDEAAELFQIGEATVHHWKRLERRRARSSRSRRAAAACRRESLPSSTSSCE